VSPGAAGATGVERAAVGAQLAAHGAHLDGRRQLAKWKALCPQKGKNKQE